jgi:ABC-type glycerol-3-phosphate transport system permease component
MTSRLRWARSAAAWIVIATIALPLLYALIGSLQPEARLFGGGLPSLRDLGLRHYRALLGERDVLHAIGHSLVVAAATTVVCVSLGSASAYALARLRFPGRRALLACVLAVSMFPQIAIVPPLYLLLRALGLIDTYPGLVLPYVTFAMPLTIWLLLGFFRQLPAELEEAARVDGAGRLRTLVEIVLPLSAPALATTALITFIYCWNEFLFALAFTLERKTLPVAIALLRGQYRVPWGEVLAAAMVSTAPIALLVLGFQRRIVQGLAAGAVKG